MEIEILPTTKFSDKISELTEGVVIGGIVRDKSDISK